MELCGLLLSCGAQNLTEAQQHKAHHLWLWAREAGISCSRDEIADMIIVNQVGLPFQSSAVNPKAPQAAEL